MYCTWVVDDKIVWTINNVYDKYDTNYLCILNTYNI